MIATASRTAVFHHNSGPMTRRTLLDFFADATSGSPAARAFLVYDDGYRTWTWTYGELAGAAHAFAARLREAGVEPGQAIALWSENRPEWIAALWGALLGGVVIVPIDYRASAEFLLKVAGIVDAKAILVGETVDAGRAGARPIWHLRDLFRPARRRSRRASSSPTRTSSPTSSRSSARWRSTGSTRFPSGRSGF
jgi:non-ribosomal peptide synthetase component F